MMWNQRGSHNYFFNQMAHLFNINKPSDWYKVKRQDIYNQGGQNLLKQYYQDFLYKVYYRNLLVTNKALISCYPELPIVPWMFEASLESGFWNRQENHK